MKATQKNKNAWVGLVVLLVILALGLWWVSASTPVDTSTDMSSATTTAATTSVPSKQSIAVTKPKVVDSSVSGVVASLTDGTKFASLYASTGVAAAITGKGPFTVFVPTNEAYNAVAGTLASMSASQKKQLVEYHVIVGRGIDPSAILAGNVQALSRDYINFSIDPKGAPRIDNAYVVSSFKATNGIVYLISSVLFPPKQ